MIVVESEEMNIIIQIHSYDYQQSRRSISSLNYDNYEVETIAR